MGSPAETLVAEPGQDAEAQSAALLLLSSAQQYDGRQCELELYAVVAPL